MSPRAQSGSVHDDAERPPSSPTTAGEDEYLDGGSDSAPRWLRPPARERPPSHWWRVGYVLAAIAVVIVVVRQLGTSDSSQQAHTVPSAPASLFPSAVDGPDLADTAALPGPIESVRALADRSGNPTDLVRQDAPAGQCAIVRPGESPVRSVLAAASKILGTVKLIDDQRTLDGATGLCSLTLRARLAQATLTVSVASPGVAHGKSALMVTTGVAPGGPDAAEYAMAHTSRGWDVLIGAVGPPQALPGPELLSRLAVSDAVTW